MPSLGTIQHLTKLDVKGVQVDVEERGETLDVGFGEGLG